MTIRITTPNTLTKPELQEIAERIRGRIRRSVADIIETGRDLARVKATLDHGEFGKWIEREFSMSMRTAQRDIQAAAWAQDKNDIVSHLQPIALYRLSAKSTPEEIGAEIVSDIKAGKTIEDLAERIGEAKEEQRKQHEESKLSPEAKKRRKHAREQSKRETEERKAEWAARDAWCKEAQQEFLTILLGLARADFERIVELASDPRFELPIHRDDWAIALASKLEYDGESGLPWDRTP